MTDLTNLGPGQGGRSTDTFGTSYSGIEGKERAKMKPTNIIIQTIKKCY